MKQTWTTRWLRKSLVALTIGLTGVRVSAQEARPIEDGPSVPPGMGVGPVPPLSALLPATGLSGRSYFGGSPAGDKTGAEPWRRPLTSRIQPPRDPALVRTHTGNEEENAEPPIGSTAPSAAVREYENLPGDPPPPVQQIRLFTPSGTPAGFCHRYLQSYPILRLWFPEHLGTPEDRKGGATSAAGMGFYEGERVAETQAGTPRRVPPAPFPQPPFPMAEYQGYPLIGVPYSTAVYPLMNAIQSYPEGEFFKKSRINTYGWATSSGNWSTSQNSNTPSSYWIAPNSLQLDQFVFRIEREADTVQMDHIDWGFRSSHLYGIDYRYTTAGGWFSDQLLVHNNLYGYDPIEQYFDLYVPWIGEGFVLRTGRWVATPDIETQFAPDNYMGSHSLLFTFDTYTQTGVLGSVNLSPRVMIQGGIHAGTDMAPWYPGATPTGVFGFRWVSEDNNDSLYIVLNNINNAKFRHFSINGQPAGHDNFNYIVGTWQHRFSPRFLTKTESYYMWQVDAVRGGTVSIGPTHLFGGGGGIGAPIPGLPRTYGILNYTMYAVSKRAYFTVRNEWWRDEEGERSGFPSNYSSHSAGLSYQFSANMMLRPEIAFYHSYDVPAFDLGTKRSQLVIGFDFTVRF